MIRILENGVVQAAAILLMTIGVATAQSVSVSTKPVGYVTIPTDPGVKTMISLPLSDAPIYSGTVSAVTSNTITDAAASFATLTASAYAVRITSGNASGRTLVITSNGATTLTLSIGTNSYLLPVDNSSGNTVNVAANDTYEVFPLYTLGRIFGTDGSVLKAAAGPNSADQVGIYSGGTIATYYNNGTNWKNAGNFLDSANYDNLPIPPDAGIWILRRLDGPAAQNLVFTGTVASVGPKLQLPGGSKAGYGIQVPVDTTLQKLNFINMLSWTKGASPNISDQVAVYKADGTLNTYYLNTSNQWKNAGNFLDANDYSNTSIPAGSGLWIVRRGTTVGSDAVAKTQLPYTP